MKNLIIYLLFVLFPLITWSQSTKKGKSIYYVENYSEIDAKRYFDNATNLKTIEGIWIKNGVKYSIEKDLYDYSRHANRYRVIVLTEKKDWIWDRGDIQYFLIPGATENIFEVTFYAIVANWSRGEREYGIQPVLAVGILSDAVNFTVQLPSFDDYGREVGYSNEVFVKLYPKQ